MDNQKDVLEIFDKFTNKYDDRSLEDDLSTLSLDDNSGVKVYSRQGEFKAISLDTLAQYPYRIARWPESNKKSDSIASTDAMLVDKHRDLIFIEFKNQAVKNTKESVNEKAYQVWHMIMDIFDEMKDEVGYAIPLFIDNPLLFAREHITYILVFNPEKDYLSKERVEDAELAGLHYRTDFMLKIEKYLYKEAFVVTERELRKILKERLE